MGYASPAGQSRMRDSPMPVTAIARVLHAKASAAIRSIKPPNPDVRDDRPAELADGSDRTALGNLPPSHLRPIPAVRETAIQLPSSTVP